MEKVEIDAQYLAYIAWSFGLRSDNERDTWLDENTNACLDELLKKIEALKPTYPDKRWEFWFSAPRGEYATYHENKKYLIEEEGFTEEEIKKNFFAEFPYEDIFFRLGVVNENGYALLYLNDTVVLRRFPEAKPGDRCCPYLDDLVPYFSKVVDWAIKSLKEGTYNELVEKNLPYERRFGTLKRSQYWKIRPKDKKYDLEGLKAREIKKFVSYLDSMDLKEKTPTGRYETMSAGFYYTLCSYCYLAAHYKDMEGKTPKEMFERRGDNRDGGLSTLDLDDEEAFEKWYKLDTEAKWKIENPSHMWEIRMGHTHSRIHLAVRKDKLGYYLSLSGGVHVCTDEVVRMFIALKERGVPVKLWDAEKIRAKVLGEDLIGIVPEEDSGWSYWYGGFPKGAVLNFVKLAGENQEELKAKADWIPLKKLELV